MVNPHIETTTLSEQAESCGMSEKEYVLQCIEKDPRFLAWFFGKTEEFYKPTDIEKQFLNDYINSLV